MAWDPPFSTIQDGSRGYIEFPSSLQQVIDYGARTDGQPVYIGFANQGVSQASTDGWLIQYFTYTTISGVDYMTLRQSAMGAWTARASLTYS